MSRTYIISVADSLDNDTLSNTELRQELKDKATTIKKLSNMTVRSVDETASLRGCDATTSSHGYPVAEGRILSTELVRP